MARHLSPDDVQLELADRDARQFWRDLVDGYEATAGTRLAFGAVGGEAERLRTDVEARRERVL